MCTTQCYDQTKCSSPTRTCPYRPIKTEADFAYYAGCNEVCGLYLDNMPNFDPLLYSVFRNLTRVRGHLSITNNKYIYSLDFLKSVVVVSIQNHFLRQLEVFANLIFRAVLTCHHHVSLMTLPLLGMIISCMLSCRRGIPRVSSRRRPSRSQTTRMCHTSLALASRRHHTDVPYHLYLVHYVLETTRKATVPALHA
jgi:hypothetical protein